MRKRAYYEQEIINCLKRVVFLEITELHEFVPGPRSYKEAATRRLLAAGVIEPHPKWRGCVRLSAAARTEAEHQARPTGSNPD